MKIGNILRQRRKLLGKTLEDIAFIADTDAGNLSRIERDEQRPSLDLLEAIAEALGTQVSVLYRDVEELHVPKTMEQRNHYNEPPVVDAQLALLIKHYYSLTDEGRELAGNLVAALKKTHSAAKSS
ncbi:helix-turn-helix transcriptional regulator [Chromatiaceae bacterium AAb-1]|nr:helix-turn-helix transcriptional regulator [Chromatiaceae bacterium AAb-1]